MGGAGLAKAKVKSKKGWVKCPICDVKMRADKLDGHMKRVHPRGVRTAEERRRIEDRRRSAKGTAKWIIMGVIVVVIILVVYYMWANLDLRGSNTGDKPYNFVLKDQYGFEYELDEHLSINPLLMGFMSIECLHCRAMVSTIKDLYINYSDRIDFVILISDDDATHTSIVNWANELGIEFPVLHDKGGKTFDIYDLRYFPTFYIVDGNGKIDWIDSGHFEYEELEERFLKVL